MCTSFEVMRNTCAHCALCTVYTLREIIQIDWRKTCCLFIFIIHMPITCLYDVITLPVEWFAFVITFAKPKHHEDIIAGFHRRYITG